MKYSIIFNGVNAGWVEEKDIGTLNLMDGVELVPYKEDTTVYDFLEVWVYGVEEETYKVFATDANGITLKTLKEGIGSLWYYKGMLYDFNNEYYVLVDEDFSFGAISYKFKRIDLKKTIKLV